ncbi:MAG TPA: dipeptidase [Bryobacteraceae bacterium]|nr:dipeptidase [Bryobacteraceae bacterium]
MPRPADAFVEANQERLLEELKAFLRIPSVSTLEEHRPDIERAAEFVAASLRGTGFRNVAVIPTGKHPLVYGEALEAPGKPTILCYGHYDVQPPDPLEEWHSPPFEPVLRNGNLYARGSADDKGQMYMHVKAVEALRATLGRLPVNIKFLVEGEEEIGGVSITRYVEENRDRLRADVALVSDTAMYAEGVPTLCTGLRGLVYMEVEAAGPARDLHSGLYGGVAPNPVFGLIELLAQVKDAQGVIRIPGFYDDIVPPAPAELESWAGLPFDQAAFLRDEVGSGALTGERGYTVFERIWARPTFEVHGVAGGFTGPGAKTVIPARATAKVSFRLVPGETAEKVIERFRAFVAAHVPAGLRIEVRVLSAAPAVLVNPDHPAIRVAARTFSDVFGRPTVYIRSGGSVPIVGDFARFLGIPTVMMGFGLPDDGLHSPNEKYRLENYYKGIATIARFFEEYGREG